jgi:hypothetical protein
VGGMPCAHGGDGGDDMVGGYQPWDLPWHLRVEAGSGDSR